MKRSNKIDLMKNDFLDFYYRVISNKSYIFCVLLFNIIAYGFSLFNRTVSMDDLSFTMFREGKWGISTMRWGIYIFAPFFNTMEYSPFIGRFIALIFLILSAVLFSFLMYILNEKNRSVFPYIILTVLFTTYPLINEAWEFIGMDVNINYNGISLFFFSTFISIIYQYYSDNYSVKSILIATLLLLPAAAGYEAVLFAYVSIVIIILYCKNKNSNEKRYNWLLDGIRYAIPLFLGLILKFAIGSILLIIFNAPNRSSVGRSYWRINGFRKTIVNILFNGWYYFIRGLSYFPITEFVFATILFIIFVIKDSKNNKQLLLLGFGIYLSLFILSIVQGYYLYYRMAQTIEVFVAYVGFLCAKRLENRKKIIKNISIITLLFICLRQSICLHELLALNNQRSDNEANIARQIGYKIYSEFDKEKIVIFCGEYQLGKFIEDQITVKEDKIAKKVEDYVRDLVQHQEKREYQEYVTTNINSYFNKQMDAFNGQTMLQKYMSYYGFDINVLADLSDEEEDKLKGYYEKIAKENNMKPLEIKDMGDYILVYLGPTIDGYDKLKYR